MELELEPELARARQRESDAENEAIEVRLLLEAIHAKYGYDLRGYSDSSLRRRLQVSLARLGLTRLSDLQHRLLRDHAVFSMVLGDLAVRVSELFRDPSFHLKLRRAVFPTLRSYPLLKIWQAGCASGEEAYATAIALIEEGLYERTQIYATDLSAQALDQAKQGVYPATRLRMFKHNYGQAGGVADLSRYCTEAYDGVAMSEAVRRNILFFQHNLVSDHVFGEMNMVFCRNVMIYFGGELRARVLQKLAQSLRPGGFLCLGSAERLTRADQHEHFEQVDPSHPIYRYTGLR